MLNAQGVLLNVEFDSNFWRFHPVDPEVDNWQKHQQPLQFLASTGAFLQNRYDHDIPVETLSNLDQVRLLFFSPNLQLLSNVSFLFSVLEKAN